MASAQSLNVRTGLQPFWTEIMIPLVICLAIILIIVSIFAVDLITVKSMQEEESALVSFAPPGFNSVWERNIQAELGLDQNWSKSSVVVANSPIEVITVCPENTQFSAEKLGASNNVPEFAPMPIVADNLAEIPFRRTK